MRGYLGFLLALAAMPSMFAADLPLPQVTKTDKVDFAPGGTIRIESSHGDLNIETWDRPEVELTTMIIGGHAGNATVAMTSKSASELAITTTFPRRGWHHLNRGKSGLMLEYRLRVPRDCHLIIHHDEGMVLLSNVSGDVEASNTTGDIVVIVPAGSGYSIDAKTRFGGVDSDFGGAAVRHKLLSRRLAFAPPAPRHRLVLRVGTGNINVQEVPASASGTP